MSEEICYLSMWVEAAVVKTHYYHQNGISISYQGNLEGSKHWTGLVSDADAVMGIFILSWSPYHGL